MKTKKDKPICSICKKEIQPDSWGWDGTNNADPINDGRCCNKCNDTIVTPTRLQEYYKRLSPSTSNMIRSCCPKEREV